MTLRTALKRSKDPSQTSYLIKRYEKELLALYEKALPQLLALLDLSTRKMQQSPVNVQQYDSGLNIILDTTISDPSSVVVRRASAANYRAGVTRSGQFLQLTGVLPRGAPEYVDPVAVKNIEIRGASLVQGLTDEMRKNIVTQLTEGIMKGEGSDELARRIRDTVDGSMVRASAIARTETMTAFNDAAKTNYEKYGVKMVEWLTAKDERLCEECEPLDGNTYPIDDVPDCPLHVNCRCTLLPVVGVSD